MKKPLDQNHVDQQEIGECCICPRARQVSIRAEKTGPGRKGERQFRRLESNVKGPSIGFRQRVKSLDRKSGPLLCGRDSEDGTGFRVKQTQV